MAFNDFSFPKVLADLDLKMIDGDLISTIPPVNVKPEYSNLLTSGVQLADANTTEKARSEFVISLVLLALKQSLGQKVAVFSGTAFEGDASRGLSGICDFILARSPSQLVLGAPIVTIVEAKNLDLVSGYAQCIAAMVAAQLLNQREGRTVSAIYGASTTGSEWRFFRLVGSTITADNVVVPISQIERILGILSQFALGP